MSKMKIAEGQEWMTFKLCHDKASDLWSIRWICKICNKQTMGEPIEIGSIGQEIQRRLKVYLCEKCTEIVRTYQNLNEPVRIELPTEEHNANIKRAIPCRNHVEFKDGCVACLNVNNNKGGFR